MCKHHGVPLGSPKNTHPSARGHKVLGHPGTVACLMIAEPRMPCDPVESLRRDSILRPDLVLSLDSLAGISNE